MNPWPTLPSAKYHVGCTGPAGRGVLVGVSEGVLVVVVVGESVLVTVGVAVFGEAYAL